MKIGLIRKGNKWVWSNGMGVLTTNHWGNDHSDSDKRCAKSKRNDNFLEWTSHGCNVGVAGLACFNLGL